MLNLFDVIDPVPGGTGHRQWGRLLVRILVA